MDETEREGYIRRIENALKSDVMEITHEIFFTEEATREILELLKEQPERPKSEWIPSFGGKFTGGAYWFECSKCKRIVPEVRNGGWNYCPSCGADMRGE